MGIQDFFFLKKIKTYAHGRTIKEDKTKRKIKEQNGEVIEGMGCCCLCPFSLFSPPMNPGPTSPFSSYFSRSPCLLASHLTSTLPLSLPLLPLALTFELCSSDGNDDAALSSFPKFRAQLGQQVAMLMDKRQTISQLNFSYFGDNPCSWLHPVMFLCLANPSFLP